MLDLQTYLVREHIGVLKLHEAYDVLDPATGAVVATAIEDASAFRQLLKLVIPKTLLPFAVVLREAGAGPEGEGKPILTIRRGFTLLRSRVTVQRPDGQVLGSFHQRLLSIGGRFDIHDGKDVKVAELQGNLIGWNFEFKGTDGKSLGTVTRQWGGMGKELFTSADNYVVALQPHVDRVGMGPLLLAAALCIDMVLKEHG
jgi:uncharacterized protein YxjI